LNNEQNVQECDATMYHACTIVGLIIIQFY